MTEVIPAAPGAFRIPPVDCCAWACCCSALLSKSGKEGDTCCVQMRREEAIWGLPPFADELLVTQVDLNTIEVVR